MSEKPKEGEWWIYESSTDRVVTRKHKFAELSVNYEPTERLYTESDIKAKDARIVELRHFVKSVANAKIEVAEISGQYGGVDEVSFISDIYVDKAKELINRVDTV